jgi:Site-specific recombinase XerD
MLSYLRTYFALMIISRGSENCKNPFSGIKVPYVESEPRRALTEEEVALITDNWRGARMGLAAMIMLYAGLRIGEVLALEWTDIDFAEHTITVFRCCSPFAFFIVLYGVYHKQKKKGDIRQKFLDSLKQDNEKRIRLLLRGFAH